MNQSHGGGDNELRSSPKAHHLPAGGGGGSGGGGGGGGGAAVSLVDASLRISAIPLSVVSIWLTVTNHQNNPTYGKLHFTNLLGLKYMVLISGLCAAYAFASAAFSWFRVLAGRAWVLFVSDQIVAYLMVTSGAAVMEILYLAYKGDREVTWSEACSSYGHFCSRTKAALVLHFLALFCFLFLSLISAYRAFSIFGPPSSISSKHDAEEN